MILMVPGLLLIVGALALALAYNALHPRFRPTGLAVASFFAGWLTGELGLHLLLANLILVLGLVAGGGLNRLAIARKTPITRALRRSRPGAERTVGRYGR